MFHLAGKNGEHGLNCKFCRYLNSLFILLLPLLYAISEITPHIQQAEIEVTSVSTRNISSMSLQSILPLRSVNNTVLLMMTDYGYLNHYLNVYYAGHLNQYPNLVVCCIDKYSYNVDTVFA